MPYFRAKLEASLEQQRDEEDFSIRLAQTRSQRLYRAAVAAYPYVSSAWQAWVFCQQLLFVFGVARTHSPLLWLARVRLARLNAQDIKNMELKTSNTGSPADKRYISVSLKSKCARPSVSIARLSKTSVETVVTFLFPSPNGADVDFILPCFESHCQLPFAPSQVFTLDSNVWMIGAGAGCRAGSWSG